jgi:foldase protein PrsA
MKRLIWLNLACVTFFTACADKHEAPKYSKDSKQYLFFKTLSVKTPLFDPDQKIPLVSTNAFTISNRNLMPRMYSLSRNNPSEWQGMQKEALVNVIRQLADQEAETRLVLIAAKNVKIKTSEDSIEKQLKPFYDKPGGKEAFIKNLKEFGLTMTMVRDDIRNRLIIDRLIKEVIFKKVSVSEVDLKKAYAMERYARVRQIRMKIYGKTAPEVEAVEKKLEALLARARGGENFSKLADSYSEDEPTLKKGGLTENVSRYLLLTVFENAVFSLPVGGISDILKTPEWLYIIKVEKRSRETQPFERIREQLRSELDQGRKRNAYSAYVDSLRILYQYQRM